VKGLDFIIITRIFCERNKSRIYACHLVVSGGMKQSTNEGASTLMNLTVKLHMEIIILPEVHTVDCHLFHY
jgi:hypothetical protein